MPIPPIDFMHMPNLWIVNAERISELAVNANVVKRMLRMFILLDGFRICQETWFQELLLSLDGEVANRLGFD